MAMYYYASKLQEASCSGCHTQLPPAPKEPAPAPPPPLDQAPLPPSAAALIHGSGLSYYDNDDYYSMVRGNKFMTEKAQYRHLVMNGGVSYVPQSKNDAAAQISSVGSAVKPLSNPDAYDVEYKEGQIVSASFDFLVEMLRPGTSKPYIFTFILCSRLFVKPHELLSKLCKRYFRNYDKVGKHEIRDMIDKEVTDMAALVRILRYWTCAFPYDFRDDRVMALVRTITQRCAADHMFSIRGDVSLMLEKLLEKLTALEQYEQSVNNVPPVTSVEQLPSGDILTLGLKPAELANQLTLVELYRLSFVGPEEFVQAFAPAQPANAAASVARPSISLHHVDSKTTRNLESYADWFNRLSYLVGTDILKAPKSKYRARVIEQWVMTARECFNLGNFNSLMAVISALNMSPVSRLKKTWSRTSTVCCQQLRQLELCVEPSGNHARYRAALAAAPTETAVPLLSVTCRDLHFANQGTPSKLSSHKVNFEKCSLLARHVSNQLASRRLVSEDTPSAPAIPAPLPHVWRFLNDTPTLTETALELLSFEREQPSDHYEKERLKRLRGAT